MIKWGILSTAKIATEQIIPAILESKNSIIYGIASRDLKKAKKLAKQFDIKETFASYKDILNSNKPEKLVQLAVKRMLPKGVLGREQFKKLHVYSSDKHPHDAQKPEIIDFKTLNRKNIVGKNYASK